MNKLGHSSFSLFNKDFFDLTSLQYVTKFWKKNLLELGNYAWFSLCIPFENSNCDWFKLRHV